MTGQPANRFLPVDLTGSRVVVTAAATGIGYVIAEAFLSRGARVAICDVNDEALDKAAKSLPGALVRARRCGPRRMPWPISSPRSTRRWAASMCW